MLKEEFKTWSADSIIKKNLLKLDLHINTLGYLEGRLPHFIELSDGGTKENR